ncbi:hypothetical protein [Paracoccus broussonetiae]|nr:hypothetical protein [Paracoccus sp. CPCC 101403]
MVAMTKKRREMMHRTLARHPNLAGEILSYRLKYLNNYGFQVAGIWSG